MRAAKSDIDGGIVAIGNAPTALQEVIKMVKEGIVKPALIIGIPVGFICAAESKEELSKIRRGSIYYKFWKKRRKFFSLSNN